MGTDEIRTDAAARPLLPDHPVRLALLDLLAELGSVTSAQAAERLGHSSGLCSFHLRQLARHGLIEEAPHDGGRARPWRLRWNTPRPAAEPATPPRTPEPDAHPARSFSEVLRLTPDETAELADEMRELIAAYRDRGGRRRTGAVPVAAAFWLVPVTKR